MVPPAAHVRRPWVGCESDASVWTASSPAPSSLPAGFGRHGAGQRREVVVHSVRVQPAGGGGARLWIPPDSIHVVPGAGRHTTCPATHRWPAGFHCTPVPLRCTSLSVAPRTARVSLSRVRAIRLAGLPVAAASLVAISAAEERLPWTWNAATVPSMSALTSSGPAPVGRVPGWWRVRRTANEAVEAAGCPAVRVSLPATLV